MSVTVQEILRTTVESRAAATVDSITRNHQLLLRMQAHRPRKVSFVRLVWSRFRDAWPLQWKRREEWDD